MSQKKKKKKKKNQNAKGGTHGGTEMIVKIQRPLASNGTSLPCLVYDEHRRHVLEVPLTAELAEAMGERPKIYATAILHTDGQLEVLEEVPARDW